MGEWSPPEGATPQQYAGPPDPRDGLTELARAIGQIRGALRDMPNHLLAQAGIRVEPGKLVIEGDLEVPNGKIKNDWLESPVVPTRFSNLSTGWGVPTAAWHTLVSATAPTPAGFSRALVIANGYWRITYSVPGVTLLGGRCRVNGVAGDEGEVDTTPSPTRSLSTFQTVLVTELAEGAPVTVDVQIDTPDLSSANANNRARISGVILWMR